MLKWVNCGDIRQCAFEYRLRLKSVVVTANGKSIDMSIVKFIYKPVFLANSPRPKVSEIMTKGFWLPQTCRWIAAQHFFQNCAKVFVHTFIALSQIFVYEPCFSFKY